MSYCPNCYNTGMLDCYCGGDNCICANNGEYPCPYCDGFDDEDFDGDFSDADEVTLGTGPTPSNAEAETLKPKGPALPEKP